ncbi:MAG: copper chaperone PCu(A)C [Mycobacteriales bacterium]
MSRRRRAVAMLLAAPLLVGCAAGRGAQTIMTQTVSDSAGADVGQLQVRNVAVAAPASSGYDKGGEAPLYLTVANSGDSADQLTSVTSDAASSVAVATGPPSAASTSASAGASSSSSPTGSASPTAGTGFPLGVPAGSALRFGPDSTHLVLQGVTRGLRSGESVQVTFTFASAGSTTLTVPVALSEDSAGG